MKKNVLITAFALTALVFAPLAFADAPAQADAPVVVEQAADTAVDIVDESGDLVLFADPDASFDALITEGWGCPHGAPSCSRDAQCDNYCGQKGWGACEAFCCACLG